MKEKEVLQKAFNLSEKESICYLKLLELGESSVQRISKETGINRITLYDILNALIKKGIAGTIIKEKVKHFYSVEPKELLSRLKEDEKEFSSIVPELERKKAVLGEKPQILLFEGKKGIDTVNNDVLKTKEIRAYGSFEIPKKMLEWQTINFLKKRLDLEIKWKGVTDSSIKANPLYMSEKYRRLTELKIDDSLKDIGTWTYIYNNKVAVLSFNKENFVGIIIEDEALNKTQRLIFDKLWKQAKK